MNVTIIADPIIPVPPVNYGGTERVVDLMCRGLVKRGHAVHLMAAPGSRNTGGKLTFHRAPSTLLASRATRKIWFQALSFVAALRADVVVNFGRLDYLAVVHRLRVPLIHWFENPLSGKEVPFVLHRRSLPTVFVGVSRAQVSEDPAADRFEVVHNAVDIEGIPFSPSAANPPYVVFLGRLTRNKGVHLAIDAACKAGVKLVIAGNISSEPGDANYFATSVKPRLGPQCEWIGPYDEETRIKVLAGATALLFPIQWSEPFGLVMVEALAGGVPVIATRRASTPEVVIPGKTGFLCDTANEMAEAISKVHKISRFECRASVAERFGEKAFIGKVEALLNRVVTMNP